MNQVQFNRKQLTQFKKLGVTAVYLFGSVPQGVATKLSDIDIGVVFSEPEKYRESTLDVYEKLYRVMSEVFAGQKREVDVVLLQFTPIRVQFRAIQGRVLYESDPETRYRYQEHVIKQHADLQYFYQVHQQAILARA